MKKNIILTIILTVLEIVLILAIKNFSYSLLLIFVMLPILTYISIVDWKTGLISIFLNFLTLGIAIAAAFLMQMRISVIGLNLAVFVLPFILLESIYQIFFNKEKDEDKFLIGGGDIVLFATMSLVLTTVEMMIMLFFASLGSLIASKIIGKTKVHFAPFVLIGFIIAFLIGG